jgi:hypothetical protein
MPSSLRSSLIRRTAFLCSTVALSGCDLLNGATPYSELQISASSTVLSAGEVVNLTATLKSPSGLVTAKPVVWRSNDTLLATIAGDGTVSGLSEGEVTINAFWENLRGEIVLRVSRPPNSSRFINFDGAGNRLTRFDVDGHAIDLHGGEIDEVDGTYYWYGEHYSCGYQWITPGAPFCGFKVYSSTDLEHWKDRGFLFDPKTDLWQAWCDGRASGCFRPHVERSPATGRYVLWINAYNSSGGFWVFESNNPAGPFELRDAPRLGAGGRVGAWGWQSFPG